MSPFHELDSYKKDWERFRNDANAIDRHEIVIYGLDSIIVGSYELLVGCCSTGEIFLWKLPPISSPDADEESSDDGLRTSDDVCYEAEKREVSSKEPLYRQKVTTGALFAVQFIKMPNQKTVLVTSGDAGVLWLDFDPCFIISIIENKATDTPKGPWFHLSFQLRPYPSPSEANVEINDFTFCNGYLFGASGDTFGCYKWDLEKLQVVKTYHSPAKGYLHTVQPVPETSLILTGGEDGFLGIWDVLTDQRVDSIDTNKHQGLDPSTPLSSRPGGRRWISSIAAMDENWWAIAGGRCNTSCLQGGFIMTWHASSRSLISSASTQETIHSLKESNGNLLSVGNRNEIDLWDPYVLSRSTRCSSTTPCGYALCVVPSGRMALAGVGNLVNVLEKDLQPSCCLSTWCQSSNLQI